MTLKLYFDLLSQPSRALYILLKQSKVPFQACPVALRNGEHLSDEYKENVSRFQKVPAIENNGFKLAESVAIIRYLAREFNIPDNFYPKDSTNQAKVDEYLEWQHNNTRAFCALYFQKKWLMPLLSGQTPTDKEIAPFFKRMSDCLDNIETLWLADSNFIVGNTLSAADIWAACEIEQPRIAGYDPRQGRPKLSAWLDRVKEAANPAYDEAHAILNKMAAKSGKAKL